MGAVGHISRNEFALFEKSFRIKHQTRKFEMPELSKAEQIRDGLSFLLGLAIVFGTSVSACTDIGVFCVWLDKDDFPNSVADIAAHMATLGWRPSEGGGKAAFEIYT